MGEGSFVMTELGSSMVLHSLTAVFKDQGRSVVNLLIFWKYHIEMVNITGILC
jgi:hypothetical protein